MDDVDYAAWLQEQLVVQKKLVFGVGVLFVAVAMRRIGFIRTEDSAPISKLTFQLFMPAMVLAKISKTPLSSELLRVAAASFCTYVLIMGVVLFLARFVSKEGGFRGQWIFCSMGHNIGFTYPLVLAVPSLADTVFPAMVVWDISGNVMTILLVNFQIAMYFSPRPDKAEDGAALTSVQACEDGGELGASVVSPSVIGGAVEAASPAPSTTQCGAELVGIEAMVTAGAGGVPRMRSHASTAAGFLAKLGSNQVLVACLLAVGINLAGIRLPTYMDEFFEELGQPFGILLFFLMGLNLVWSTVRPRLHVVAQILLVRFLICAPAAALFWSSPILPKRAWRQAAVMCLSCPVSGMAMSYAIDWGYDRGLQAALATMSNVVSLSVLWLLMMVP